MDGLNNISSASCSSSDLSKLDLPSIYDNYNDELDYEDHFEFDNIYENCEEDESVFSKQLGDLVEDGFNKGGLHDFFNCVGSSKRS